jgi:hypothetical protein
MMTLVTAITMTAVSRVSAAQPDAFWLACERGCDTLFVHDLARQSEWTTRIAGEKTSLQAANR